MSIWSVMGVSTLYIKKENQHTHFLSKVVFLQVRKKLTITHNDNDAPLGGLQLLCIMFCFPNLLHTIINLFFSSHKNIGLSFNLSFYYYKMLKHTLFSDNTLFQYNIQYFSLTAIERPAAQLFGLVLNWSYSPVCLFVFDTNETGFRCRGQSTRLPATSGLTYQLLTKNHKTKEDTKGRPDVLMDRQARLSPCMFWPILLEEEGCCTVILYHESLVIWAKRKCPFSWLAEIRTNALVTIHKSMKHTSKSWTNKTYPWKCTVQKTLIGGAICMSSLP